MNAQSCHPAANSGPMRIFVQLDCPKMPDSFEPETARYIVPDANIHQPLRLAVTFSGHSEPIKLGTDFLYYD